MKPFSCPRGDARRPVSVLPKIALCSAFSALALVGCSSPRAYVGDQSRTQAPSYPPSLTQGIALSPPTAVQGARSYSATQRLTNQPLTAPTPTLTPTPTTTTTLTVPPSYGGGVPRERRAVSSSARAAAQANAGLTQRLLAPIRGLFDGRDDPANPPGTRGSADITWSDDGNGAAPSHWRAIGFGELPGWRTDNHVEALGAFLRSCETIGRRPGANRLGSMSYSGNAGQWQLLCRTAQATPKTRAAARAFFEQAFQPYFIPGPGKFTGYYEASLNGSRTRHGAYQWPLYRRPADLVDGQAYYDRAQIDGGALAGRGLELLWIDNPVDVFYLQVQGSGVVTLDDGSQVRVGFAGHNGHRFQSLSQALAANGYDTAVHGATIQANRNWLLANAGVARQVMNANPRYIFFDFNTAPAARGDGGTLLTPQRSMAVDKRIIPLHAPLWVTTNVPGPGGQGQVDVARLMIAQDTGNAIRGEIRGDYYWGPGREAFARAGGMWGQGTYRVLLPKFIPPQ